MARTPRTVDAFLIDEIGKMECHCAQFIEAVYRLLEGPVPVVASIALRGGGFLACCLQKGADHLVTIAAHGKLSLVGETSVSGKYKLFEIGRTSKWTLSGGTTTFTDSVGDKIDVTFSGSGKETTQFSFSVKGKITGGSGHFKGATGTFSATGTADNATGTFQMNVTLTAKTKAVS